MMYVACFYSAIVVLGFLSEKYDYYRGTSSKNESFSEMVLLVIQIFAFYFVLEGVVGLLSFGARQL